MQRAFFPVFAAVLVAAAACADQTGPQTARSALLPDSGGDSTPGRRPPGPVASIVIFPPADTVAVGDSAGFFAQLLDRNGTPTTARVQWSVADPSVARIDGVFGQSVLMRALRVGSTTVTALSQGKRATAFLFVDTLPPPPPPPDSSVASVQVTPDSIIIVAGDTAEFLATLRDSAGNVIHGPAVSWTVSDSTIANFETLFGEAVILRGLRSGIVTVTASSQGKSGSGLLIVQ